MFDIDMTWDQNVFFAFLKAIFRILKFDNFVQSFGQRTPTKDFNRVRQHPVGLHCLIEISLVLFFFRRKI